MEDLKEGNEVWSFIHKNTVTAFVCLMSNDKLRQTLLPETQLPHVV